MGLCCFHFKYRAGTPVLQQFLAEYELVEPLNPRGGGVGAEYSLV